MDAKEEVKARLGIEDVIAEYVELKRAGRNFKGLSPFSAERTPSFVVSPEKGIWHDFSSGKGGDMFSFVMEVEGMDFKQALEHLARKVGVDLEQFRGASGGDGKHKKRLYEANELAAKFYQVQLSQNKPALEYVRNTRQFSKETILEWQLGYSPSGGKALCDFLKSKNFTADEVADAGLATPNRYDDGRLRDMFRGRLQIPLHDATGRVIGFTARLLDNNTDAPKYINTPQTALYDKSRHVYGLHLAKETIRKSGFVVIAEGNLDVIGSHQADVRQVVATAGTAMTEQQLKALSKFTGDIRLSYDQDKAGMNATERAIGVAAKVGVSLSMITIPSGKDPDELCRQDPALWRQVIGQNQYALDWLIDRYQSLLDITSAPGKREFSSVLLPVVRGLSDSVEQDHYLQKIADILGVRQEALTDKFEQTTAEAAAPKRLKPVTAAPVDKVTAEHLALQNRLMALTLMQPSLRPEIANLLPDMLYSDDARALLAYLLTADSPKLLDGLKPFATYAKQLSLLYEHYYQEVTLESQRAETIWFRERLIKEYVVQQKALLSARMDNSDADRDLLRQSAELDKLLT